MQGYLKFYKKIHTPDGIYCRKKYKQWLNITNTIYVWDSFVYEYVDKLLAEKKIVPAEYLDGRKCLVRKRGMDLNNYDIEIFKYVVAGKGYQDIVRIIGGEKVWLYDCFNRYIHYNMSGKPFICEMTKRQLNKRIAAKQGYPGKYDLDIRVSVGEYHLI